MHGRIRGFLFLTALAALALPAGLLPGAAYSHGDSSGPDPDRSAPATTDTSSSRSSPPPSYSPAAHDDRSWSEGASRDSSTSSWKSDSSGSSSETGNRSEGSSSGDSSSWSGDGASGDKSASDGQRDENRARISDPGLTELPYPSNWIPARQPLPGLANEQQGLNIPAPYHQLVPPPVTGLDQPFAPGATGSTPSGNGQIFGSPAALLAAPLSKPASALSVQPDSMGETSTALPHISWAAAPPANYGMGGGMIPGATLYSFARLMVLPVGFSVPSQTDVDILSTDDNSKPDQTNSQKGAPQGSTGHENSNKTTWRGNGQSPNGGDEHKVRPGHSENPALPVWVKPPTGGNPVSGSGPQKGASRFIPGPPVKPRTASLHLLPGMISCWKVVYLRFGRGESETSGILVPPLGERFVVMYISQVNGLPKGQSVHLSYSTFVPASNMRGSVRSMILDPGDTLTVSGRRDCSDGGGSVLVYFYGYLTAVPHNSDLP